MPCSKCLNTSAWHCLLARELLLPRIPSLPNFLYSAGRMFIAGSGHAVTNWLVMERAREEGRRRTWWAASGADRPLALRAIQWEEVFYLPCAVTLPLALLFNRPFMLWETSVLTLFTCLPFIYSSLPPPRLPTTHTHTLPR